MPLHAYMAEWKSQCVTKRKLQMQDPGYYLVQIAPFSLSPSFDPLHRPLIVRMILRLKQKHHDIFKRYEIKVCFDTCMYGQSRYFTRGVFSLNTMHRFAWPQLLEQAMYYEVRNLLWTEINNLFSLMDTEMILHHKSSINSLNDLRGDADGKIYNQLRKMRDEIGALTDEQRSHIKGHKPSIMLCKAKYVDAESKNPWCVDQDRVAEHLLELCQRLWDKIYK